MGYFKCEECNECEIWKTSRKCLSDCMETCGKPLDILENWDRTLGQMKQLDELYTEKCGQIKEIVKRLEKEAEDAKAGGHPEISGAYIRAVYIIKEIAEGCPKLDDDKLVSLAVKAAGHGKE